MSNAEPATDPADAQPAVVRGVPSAFEQLITNKPPVLESLIAQLPTESILALYHTSSYLKQFFEKSPTSWRYISWRLHQPAQQSTTPAANNSTSPQSRQSSNYALDQLLLYVISPFSTRLTSLELDNTAVSGATLFQTVMVLRKDTLEHVSVRGCKNVSLKYHINPWLMMHAMALDRPHVERAPGYERLALKSLYTYRCRHHRRRPYLPSSLARKESDSEPTHELVLTCNKLGIWTDTAWCTTPGARCFRRRGYVTMRVPQDPREVWVVFDRLWRSRNWLGPVPDNRTPNAAANTTNRKRKRGRDCRSWEVDEEAWNGEPLGTTGEGKAVPTHRRQTHTQFVEEIYCDNCSDPINERCEQCSVMMHCSGCRKTLCASCAFDRPYLRNKNAPQEDRQKFWWAPGCAVSPCSMQDQDLLPPGPTGNPVQPQTSSPLPSIKFKWCCTEPVFSGGGGITFGTGSAKETDRIRAAPLKPATGWEDPEFSPQFESASDGIETANKTEQIGTPLSRANTLHGPLAGRWPSIDSLFHPDPLYHSDRSPASVPRILCDECHSSEQWKIKCKACSMALCLKHDVKDRLKVRICGYKDLNVEKSEYRSRQKALKLLTIVMLKRKKEKMRAAEARAASQKATSSDDLQIQGSDKGTIEPEGSSQMDIEDGIQTPRPTRSQTNAPVINAASLENLISGPIVQNDGDRPTRPLSPSSNSTGPPSRASSPAPSALSIPATPEPTTVPGSSTNPDASPPLWKGCQSFFCPSARTPGDHRRRCVAIMRQCTECKVFVCEHCVSGLQAACPCKGCRVTPGEGTTNESSSEDSLRFFCPNCRWTRRKTGKCKKRIPEASRKGAKITKRALRSRKPVQHRRSQRTSSASHDPEDNDQAYEYLSDFMQSLEVTDSSPVGKQWLDSVVENPSGVTDHSLPTAIDGGNPEELRQLEDMGALARDLIQRIQHLRRQLGPGSLAALALPNITVQDPMLQAAREQEGVAGVRQRLVEMSSGSNSASSQPSSQQVTNFETMTESTGDTTPQPGEIEEVSLDESQDMVGETSSGTRVRTQ